MIECYLQQVGRCPRCGYTLRYDRTGYRCDYCGYPHTREPMTTRLRRFERDLHSRIEKFADGQKQQQYPRMTVQYRPNVIRQRLCESCGLRILEAAQTCPYCGSAQSTLQTNAQQNSPPPPAMQPGDQQVLDYIASHQGTISLSQAAQDLSISPAILHLTIERLKSAGFLRPT